MDILPAYPPNFERIKEVLNPPRGAIFAVGNIIYNPSNQDIYPDLYAHEEVHERQQKIFGNVELWWDKYLLSKEFRQSQEIEAYHTQLEFLKGKMPNKAIKELLHEMAVALSTDYKLDLSYHQAESRIRLYNRQVN